nr:anti-sigma-D factor RsdA [Mycobacterium asiaticum]
MRNSDFGKSWGERPGLDSVAHTDLLLDALAARSEVALGDPERDALTALLGDWRDDLRWPPASALVSQDEAEDALRAGMMDRGRGRRGLAAVGSVAATLLMLSGFGAVVADARPGDLLYGLHAMMFNEPRVSDDQIMLSAKADLAKVQQMIDQGQWDQAQTQLAEVSSTLQGVNDGSRRQGLLDEVTQLNTKVEKRDPNATVRPASPPSTQSAPEGPTNSWTPPGAPAEATDPTTTVPSESAPATTTVPAESTPATTQPAPSQSATTTTSTTTTTTTTTTRQESTSATSTPAPPATSATTAPATSAPTAPATSAPTAPATSAPAAPTTSAPTTSAPTTSAPASQGAPKPSTSATPGATVTSPAAGATTVPTPSGQLWDRASGPATPRTPFPASPTP